MTNKYKSLMKSMGKDKGYGSPYHQKGEKGENYYYFNEKYWSHKSRRMRLNRYQQAVEADQLSLNYSGKMSRKAREEYNRNENLLKRIKNIGIK